MEAKDLEFGQSVRGKMTAGAKKLAMAVKATLGPRGRNVVIQKKHGAPHITKDGVSVAKEVFLKDTFEDMGAQIIKQAASKTADIAGDGTTSSTVIAEAILSDGMKLVAAEHDPMSIKRGIDKCSAEIIKELKKLSREVSDDVKKNEIRQVATISANGDASIGDIIAEAMAKVGKHGVVSLEDGKGRESNLRTTDGFEFDRGYLHEAFCNDVERQRVVLENPYVWVINGKVNSAAHMSDMMPVLDYLHKNGMTLLMIAEDVEHEVLATLVYNKMRGALNCVAVKAPGFGDTRKDLLKDIGVITGAAVHDSAAGKEMFPYLHDNYDANGEFIAFSDLSEKDKESRILKELGRANRVIITKENTTIIGNDGRENFIEERIKVIKASIQPGMSAWDVERIEKRLAKLTGGVAVIEVGAATEVEMKERKDRFEDALAATKAAVQEGIVAGGGVALVRAAQAVKGFTTGNTEEDAGVKLLLNAATTPFKQIVENAGQKGEVVLNSVLAEKDVNLGYDAAQHQVVDMFKAGVLDPTKVVRIALENAVSVAGTMLTMECAIAFADTEEKNKQQGIY